MLKMDNIWLTSVHVYILNDICINGMWYSCVTIDQSASRLIDDVMRSTNEIIWTRELNELKWTVQSVENILVIKSPCVLDFKEVGEYSSDS